MATQGEDVYATLLLNDLYLPGALVLAHSLKDAGTAKKLAVLVTTDTVSADTMTALQRIYDYIIPVERISNRSPANLFLMDRSDLHSTFTKITLWKQTQFRRIVYVDADMVALRAPDELFHIPQPFSAAPDIGWPDIFNTGLMVLNPNMGDYYALLAMAQRGISFDGADQGLLNMHFKNSFNRLSFTYNVTPSAHYQYLPAYRHFQSGISMAHFIGKDKPWAEGREAHKGASPYDEMVGRWWAVYDRHFRHSPANLLVRQYVKGEVQEPGYSSSQAYQPKDTEREILQPNTPVLEEALPELKEGPKQVPEAHIPPVPRQSEQEPDRPAVTYSNWDASREAPPTGSRPEASNFPNTQYQMSSDATPFQAPERYPDPPKDMYYEVPTAPSYQKPARIFPWERNDAPRPTRVFAEDLMTERPRTSDSAATTSTDDEKAPVTPMTPAFHITPADPWQTFNSRVNAWDDIPEIERYIGHLQKSRKGNIQVLQGCGAGIDQVSSPGGQKHGLKLTDFPTELERPSLPVTPAPIRRPTFWGEERDGDGKLPVAEGVPSQEDWDPAAQLEKLARRQSEVLSHLGESPSREIPSRPLPYGSEGVISPTYKPVRGPHRSATPGPGVKIEEPSFHGPGAMYEKDEINLPVQHQPLDASEEDKDALDN